MFPQRLVLFSILAISRVTSPAETTLISDSFNTAGPLNGTLPGTTVNGARWITKTTGGVPSSNNGVLIMPGSNQTNVIDLGPGFFANNPGIYALSMEISLPAGTSGANCFGLGFVTNPVLTGSLAETTSKPGLNPSGGLNSGTPWVYIVQSGKVFVNNHDSNYVYQSATGSYPSGVPHTLKLVLDTTQPKWRMTAFLDAVQVDLNGGLSGLAHTWNSNPADIRYVALSCGTSSIAATIDDFKLTGPAQNTLPPPLDPILILDDFNTTGPLNGTVPNRTVQGASWVAKTTNGAPTCNAGSLALPGSNQTNTLDLGNGYFTTHPGVYALSMDITLPSTGTGPNLFGFGFVVNPSPTSNMAAATSSPGLNPGGGTNGGTPWMYIDQGGRVSVNRDSNYIYQSGGGAFPAGTKYNLKLILNTSGKQWTMSAFVGPIQLDLNGPSAGLEYKYTSNPANIRYVGMTSATSSITATVDRFALNYYPDPTIARIGDLTAPAVVPGARPYNDGWVEGESYTSQVGGITIGDGSSYGGSKWSAQSSSPASVTYTVNVPVPGLYLLNIAGSRIGAATSSKIAYSIDGGVQTVIEGGTFSGSTWSSGELTWNSAAMVNFSTRGTHTITISLVSPRSSDGMYAFTIDALALVADPFNNLLYTQANFAHSQTWATTATASTSDANHPVANVMQGNSSLGWKPTESSQSTLTLTFSSSRSLEVLRLVKGLNAPVGASMPTSYKIDLLENGSWVTRVDETNNVLHYATYMLPRLVNASAVRLTVRGVQDSAFAYVNQLEAYGPFSPVVLSPADAGVIGNGFYTVSGFTQPNATVALRVNGAASSTVMADGSGWFSGQVNFTPGDNTLQAQSLLNNSTSVRQSSVLTYDTSAAAAISITNRKGHYVTSDEGVNRVVVSAVGQGNAVPYSIKNESGAVISNGSIDLSRGSALLDLPTSTAGWYQVAIQGAPALTQGLSVLPSSFVLPPLSTVGTNIMVDGTRNKVSTVDQSIFVPVISDYTGMSQSGWVRDCLSWPSVNSASGVYSWSSSDDMVEMMTAGGQKMLLQVYDFPPFLNSRNDYRYVPDDLRSTYAWGQVLGTHFKGKVGAYEFQNEFEWKGSAVQTTNTLMAHHRAFYLGVKSADPNVIVAPNPPALVDDVAKQLQNLRGEAADVVAFHSYPLGNGSAQVTNLQSGDYNMSSQMKKVTGLLENRAAWLTETGYYGVSGATLTPADELAQADFYAKMAPLSMSYGIAKSFAFCFPYYPEGTKQFGMLRYGGFSPCAAVNSSAVTAQQLRATDYYGLLNTGNPNITGLVLKRTDGTYLLALWATNAAGVGGYSLPAGVAISKTVDYLGRVTDIGSTNSINVQTTAKFVSLSGSAITAATTLSPNISNPSETGIAPSRIVMGWHFNLSCKASAAGEDFYDIAPGGISNCFLEVVNLSSSAFSGTIAVTPSNPRWMLTPGASLTVSIPANGRVEIPFTLRAPSQAKDTVRVETRVLDQTGLTSSAVEELRTTGTAPLLTGIQPDSSGNIMISCTTSTQNYFGYSSRWIPGTEGSVNYMTPFPASEQSFSDSQMFKAPRLDYLTYLNAAPGGTWYYVWVKAKSGPGNNSKVNIGMSGRLHVSTTGVTGFNSNGWTWSRTLAGGGHAKYLAVDGSGNRTITVWPTDANVQIAYIFLTTSSTFIPTF